MAGKTGKKVTTKAEEPRTYFVRLELEEGDHRKLRVRAAAEGLPMSTYVKNLVVEHLNEGGPSK